jgi:hypothetical protein
VTDDEREALIERLALDVRAGARLLQKRGVAEEEVVGVLRWGAIITMFGLGGDLATVAARAELKALRFELPQGPATVNARLIRLAGEHLALVSVLWYEARESVSDDDAALTVLDAAISRVEVDRSLAAALGMIGY